jgi:hypothetical protein
MGVRKIASAAATFGFVANDGNGLLPPVAVNVAHGFSKEESIYRKIDNAVFWNAAKVSGCVRAHHNFIDASTISAFFETTLVLLVMRPR